VKILVLGTGGREHALAWRCAQEIGFENVALHPGNPGAFNDPFVRLGDVPPTDAVALSRAAKQSDISLVLIGPEALLAQDLAKKLRADGFLVVGPDASGSRLETSKVFAKQTMANAHIPTASFSIARNSKELLEMATTFPCALKYDGLAAGKGVAIPHSQRDVQDFADRIWKDHEFGANPTHVLVESFLKGKEISLIGFCDGNVFRPLATATDYKRVGDADQGPNTGGMGSISPSPWERPGIVEKVQAVIAQPLLRELKKQGIDYRGILYIGLMIDSGDNPFVVEFNARFGDPETQALMMRIEHGFVENLLATAEGKLADAPPLKWSPSHSVYVVAAAGNYPAKPRTGDKISGIPVAESASKVFYSGVKFQNGNWLTDGGRVLGVGSLGRGFAEARQAAYRTLDQIKWDQMHFRKDIGSV
jgi:phosphoribosylamine---glycine ligase